MRTDLPLTPWTRDEMKARAYVTAKQMRTPSTWDDEPKDADDLVAAIVAIRKMLFSEAQA